MNDRVFQIHAYFPSEHFDIVWLALRERYGKENRRDEKMIEWLSGERHLDKPIPDEIYLLRSPESVVLVDPPFFRDGVTYSVIEYNSSWDANERLRVREERNRREVKGVADGL